MNPPVNLLNFDYTELLDFIAQKGEKPFRATQIFQSIHQRGIDDFESMTTLSKSFRQLLLDSCTIELPKIYSENIAKDGTYKWILNLADNNAIETVFIPEDHRGTLCVSSQVGCALSCDFCSTGHQGFNRNLSTAEIIGQVWIAARRLSNDSKVHDHHITNIVMMGMGEPLLNFNPVVKAMSIMRDDRAYGLPKKRVTLSTSGIAPAMLQLSQISDVAMAVSLHAPNDELRSQIMPINKKYSLKVLMAACKNYFPKNSRRKITFEYVMLAGINDQPVHAKQLINLLSDIPAKVNLIPFNPFPQSNYQCSTRIVIEQFQEQLKRAGLIVTIRKTRGQDIDAACGQLVGQVKDKTRRQKQYKIEQIAVQEET